MIYLKVLVLGTLHWLGRPARAALEALAECDGTPVASGFLAARAGLTNRHQLARLFHKEGLPPLEETAGWVQLLGWVLAWESGGWSLCHSALRAGRDPAVCYRIVRRLTGLPWRKVRALGTAWVLLRLLDRCKPPSADRERQRALPS